MFLGNSDMDKNTNSFEDACPHSTSLQYPVAKYQKLATEYAKLRAQAGVLKKAVLEEQAKSNSIREILRERETSLRRCEQEVDSLSFRNNQLEHRVASLQDELAIAEREKSNHKKGVSKKEVTLLSTSSAKDLAHDALIFEELQKKIMENAQLTSLIDDKERDLVAHSERISTLEIRLKQANSTQSDKEKCLRRDLGNLQSRNADLESKLIEAVSMMSSEDTLSVEASEGVHQSTLPATNTRSERIASLEREVAHWRTQFEIAKLQFNFDTKVGESDQLLLNESKVAGNGGHNTCNSTTAAAGLTVKPSTSLNRTRDSIQEPLIPPTKEQMIFNCFSEKFEDLMHAKCVSESLVNTFSVEIDHLQNCLENATFELKAKDELVQNINQAVQLLEDDLSTTRVNYEEQISVLTEQVINLSDQLAASK